MHASWMVTVFEIIDTIMEGLDHRSHVVAPVPDAEVFTVAVVAGDRASGVAGAVGAGAGQAGGGGPGPHRTTCPPHGDLRCRSG